MRKAGCVAVIILICTATLAFSSQVVTPTTTLSLEKGNNTSTSGSFQGQANGNAAPGNASKVSTRELLYDGASTGIYAHYMPWYGSSSHINVGYSTADPAQVERQVTDMISRGIQGVIIDWYGPNSAHADLSSTVMMKEAEKHQGFKFAIMEDSAAVRNATDKTRTLISDLVYAWQTYQQSSAYLKVDGRPVVFFFDVELLPIDWNEVRTQVPGNPIFVFQNSGSFSNEFADGGFAWVGSFSNVDDWGQAYLYDFYRTGLASPKLIVGSVKKGFNDTLAVWGEDRIINQNCGQTWLNTFAEIGRHFSASKQLDMVQLVTWNDYEEGTAIEMGIDNCVSVDVSVSGSRLTWNIAGEENTIHHYSVFISTDGENLMKVTDVPAGNRELDLASFDFATGAYTVYVKAVGQPSIRNKMSGPIGYTAGSLSGTEVDLKLAAAPATVSVARGGSASTSIVLTPTGDFKQAVTLNCLNLPAGVRCSFDRQTVTPGTTAVSVKLTISADHVSTARREGFRGSFAFYLPVMGLGMVILGADKLSRKQAAVGLSVLLAVIFVMAGCGTVTTPVEPQASTPGSYTFTIVGQASSFQRSTTATLTVQ